MPDISDFYGIVVYMYFKDVKKHKQPHVHFKYGGDEVVFDIVNLEKIEGEWYGQFRKKCLRWAKLHHSELLEFWNKAVNGEGIGKIDPLP